MSARTAQKKVIVRENAGRSSQTILIHDIQSIASSNFYFKSYNHMNKRPSSKALEKGNFMDDFYDWLESDEANQYQEIQAFIEDSMEGVELDTKKRLFIFKKKRRTFNEVVEWIQSEMKREDVTDIKTCLINWMEMSYVPEHIDEDDVDAMDAFEDEVQKWVKFAKNS
jgi:hypothetical protein